MRRGCGQGFGVAAGEAVEVTFDQIGEIQENVAAAVQPDGDTTTYRLDTRPSAPTASQAADYTPQKYLAGTDGWNPIW